MWSFDVFDTLVVRRVAEPSGVALLTLRALSVAGRLEGRSLPVLLRARLDAEQSCSAWLEDGAPHLSVVWAEAVATLGLDPHMAAVLAAAEYDMELRLASPGPAARLLLQRRRHAGARTVILSDTLLTTVQLRGLLAAAGYDTADLAVYSSADAVASKGSGRLFKVAALDLGVPTRRLHHHGDDDVHDLGGARAVGARCEVVREARPTVYERCLAAEGVASDALATVLAGAARMARLEHRSHLASTMLDPAAGAVAPLLVAYVLWVLRQARREGYDRLYFVSQDGQVLHRIAEVLGPATGWDSSQLRYLQVSRRVLNPLLVDPADPQAWAWTWSTAGRTTPSVLLDRTPLSEAGRAGLLADAAVSDAEAPLSVAQRRVLIALLAAPSGGRGWSDELAQQRQWCAEYLAQEGATAPGRVAFVDGFGVGSQVQALGMLRQRDGLEPPGGYYLVRAAGPGPRIVATDEQGWLHDAASRRGADAPRELVLLFELVARAPHGKVLAYRKVDGDIIPVTRLPPTGATDPATCVADVAVSVAQHLTETLHLCDLDADVRTVLTQNYARFWLDPDVATVRSWQTMRLDGAESTPIAWPLRWSDMIRLGVFGTFGWQRWEAGSMALSTPSRRWVAQRAVPAVRWRVAGLPLVSRVLRQLVRALRALDRRPTPR